MNEKFIKITRTCLEITLFTFIALKIIGLINWSWWWVLSPFLIPFCIWLPIFIILLIRVKIARKKRIIKIYDDAISRLTSLK